MKKVSVLLILIVFTTSIASFWWIQGAQPIDKTNKTQKIFVVRKGQSIREIATSLKNEGLIKDTVIFFLLVKKLGIEGKIQAGDFRLSPSQNAQQIAENLTHGTLDVWITIPEGKRAEEIADTLQKEIPTYNPTWKTTLIQYEGYLFPDTYLIPKDANISLITNLMTKTFEKRFQALPLTNTTLTKNEIVIIASLIEREAKHDQDRPLVASVLINRLSIGMPLQIDATIQYALGYQPYEKTWWKKELTKEDLTIRSPFNTYKNTGIPPAPIANPGLKALMATTNPANTDYLYYISDKQGVNHYAKTLEEHNANIKKYGL